MDNEKIVIIGDKELHFKLKSQSIVTLEKIFNKNIFEVFVGINFTEMQTILYECLTNKDELSIDKNEMMDLLLTKYTLLEMPEKLLSEIAIVSGLIKQKEVEDEDNDLKNA